MKYVVIFGPPGSGKGTQSDKIIEKYGYAHISTGDVIRGEIKNKTAFGEKATEYINAGQLVPDELIIDMLESTLNKTETTTGVIFDGFPRTTPQAAALKAMLNKNGGDVTAMISLEVPNDELLTRLVERGKVSGRSDDNPETIKARIQVYETETAPVMDFYKNEGVYSAINGVGSIDDIFGQIVKVLG